MGFVLTGATLIDGNGGEPVANAAVHVKGDRIAWVGSAANSAGGSAGGKAGGCVRQVADARS